MPLTQFSTTTSGPGDSIDLSNLNIHLVMPIMHKAGRGMPFGIYYTYDSNVWSPAGGAWQPTSSSWGLTPELEASSGYITYATTNDGCWDYDNRLLYEDHFSGFVFHDENGVAHAFSISAWDGNSRCGDTGGGESGNADDGSGYGITATGTTSSSGTGAVTVTITTPDGQNLHPPVGSPTAAGITTDPNGNTITSTGSTFTDTMGMTALTINNYQGYSTLVWTDASGSPQHATVTYTNFPVRTNFGCPNVAEYANSSVPLITSIALPNGESWTFSYEPTPGYGGDVTGRLASVTLPTGGTISYAYSGVNCADGRPLQLTRTSPDGTTNYYGGYSSTNVVDPMGNETVLNFSGDYLISRKIYSGDEYTGTLLRTDTICYASGGSPTCGTGPVTYPVTERYTTTTTDTNLVSAIDQKFDSHQNPIETDVYGFGAGAVGSLVRKTIITYASNLGPGENIQDRPSEIKVVDGSANWLADTQFAYDANANPTSVKKWVSGGTYRTSTLTYNANGEITQVLDPNNNATAYTFDPSVCAGAFPTAVSAGGLTTTATWNCNVGEIATSTDANGQTTTYTYADPMGRPTEVDAPGPAGSPARTVMEYANAVEEFIWASTSSDALPASDTGWRHTDMFADWAGRPAETQLVNDPAGAAETTISYDALGRPASVSNPYHTTSDPTYGTTQFAYDALNRKTAITAPDGSVSHIYYGPNVATNGGLGAPACTGTVGYPVETVSAEARRTQVWLDAEGHVLEADEPDAASGSLASGNATCYGYTALGQLAWVHQGVQKRALAYDGLGEVINSRIPEATANISGPSVDGSSLWSEAVTYDGDGNAISRTDANGVTTTLAYDALNRLTGETFGDSTPAITFKYDSTAGCTVPAGASPANLAGRRACALDANGTYTLYSYDPAGDVTDTWDQTPGVLAHQGYTYFYNRQLASYTNPEGDAFTYALDAPGRVTTVTASTGWNGGETVFSAGTYDAAGVLTTSSLGNSGQSITRTLNNDLEATEIAAVVGGATAFDRTYGYDHDALLTSMTDKVNSAYSQTFAYDYLRRLTSTAMSGSPSLDSSFTYDRYANLTSMSGGEYWAGGVHAHSNHVIGTGYYNDDGEMQLDGYNTYTWNARGELATVAGQSAASYVYDALGRRVRSVSNITEDYIYRTDGSLAAVYNASTSSWERFEFSLNGAPVETYTPTPPTGYGAYTYSTTDLVGTPALRVNAQAGNKTYTYLPYGKPWTNQTVDPSSSIGFAGYEAEPGPVSELMHTAFRDYAGTEARWLSPDPAGWSTANPADPQSWNRYTYMGDAPALGNDPLGLCHVDHDTHTVYDDSASSCIKNPVTTVNAGGGVNPLVEWDFTYSSFNVTAGTTTVALRRKLDPGVAPQSGGADKGTCQLLPPGGNYNVGTNALALFQPKMAKALTSAFDSMNSRGITPTINSGYRSPTDQLRMRNGASGPNPAAVVSWHEAGMAVDINGTTGSNFPTIVGLMQAQGLTWGGDFRPHPDAPHFQLAFPGTNPSAAMVSACAAAAGGHP